MVKGEVVKGEVVKGLVVKLLTFMIFFLNVLLVHTPCYTARIYKQTSKMNKPHTGQNK